MENQTLDDKILHISCIADQISTIAFCASTASFTPEVREKMLNDILHGIENLSKQISNELDELSISLGSIGEVVV